MKLYLIDPHEDRLYKNGLFNPKLDSSFVVWVKIKKLLLIKKIILDTIDLHPVEKADKIFFFDHQTYSLFNHKLSHYLQLCIQKKIPKNKLNLIISESPIMKPETWLIKNHIFYGKIFTWNDALIDNKKYFHYSWLQNIEYNKPTKVRFEDKKLITVINAQKTNYLPNELYSLRVKAIRYFEKKYPDDFDLYGVGWEKPLNLKFVYSALKNNPVKTLIFLKDYIDSLRGFSSYKGFVNNKLAVLSQYKFCLCFENMKDIDGYITEKIFDCFKANCVPIYYGASNISKYIPSDTFINFRQFKTFDEMYSHMINMDKKTYNGYLISIKKFIKSNQLKKWNYQSYCSQVFLNNTIKE